MFLPRFYQPIAAMSGGVSYEAEALTLFAAMTSAPDATRKGVINTCIKALKDAGIFTKIDALWLLAAGNAHDAGLSWINPATFALTAVNSPTFTTDRGYTGNRSNMYLDDGVQMSALVKWAQTAGGLFVWRRTLGTGFTAEVGSISMFVGRIDDTDMDYQHGGDNFQAGVSTMLGFFGVTRNGDVHQPYANAELSAGDATTISGTSTLGTRHFNILRRDDTGPLYSDTQVAFAAITGLLTLTEAGNLRTAIAAYMTAIGA